VLDVFHLAVSNPDLRCAAEQSWATATASRDVRILCAETIVHMASEAVDRLHGPLNPAARRAFARMQILVGKAAEEASAALAHGDQLMAALANHLQARHAKPGRVRHSVA
jgi:hypothetical protein